MFVLSGIKPRDGCGGNPGGQHEGNTRGPQAGLQKACRSIGASFIRPGTELLVIVLTLALPHRSKARDGINLVTAATAGGDKALDAAIRVRMRGKIKGVAVPRRIRDPAASSGSCRMPKAVKRRRIETMPLPCLPHFLPRSVVHSVTRIFVATVTVARAWGTARP